MTKTFSLLRRFQYKHLSQLALNGDVLDIGGARESGYHELIGGTHTFYVANLKGGEGVDMVFDAEQHFPIGDARYDNVVMLNVLEHLFNYQNAISESFRVLKRGGTLVGSTPFLFNVHGSPNDYFRYTKSALERMFADAGFTGIVVTELGTGAFSVVYHALLGLYRFAVVKECMARMLTWLDRVANRIKKDGHFSPRSMPLGYFFEARKP